MRAAAALVRALLAADDAAAALGHARGSGARAAILYSFISRALRARAAARVKQPEATQSQRARLPGGYPPGLLHAAIPYSFGFCSCSFCFRRCSFCFCSCSFSSERAQQEQMPKLQEQKQKLQRRKQKLQAQKPKLHGIAA